MSEKKSKREHRAFEDPTENPESLYSWEDVEERRQKALALHTRGKSVRAIAQRMGVSHGTISRDINIAKESGVKDIEEFDRDKYVTETITGYKDIVREAWRIYDVSDSETRLKALNMVRLTLKDLRQALQDTGPLKKENDSSSENSIHWTIIANWSPENIKEAAQALLGARLNTKLEDPEPPEMYEKDIIDVEEYNNEGDNSDE